ncbi:MULTISPECIES: YegP family protein [Thermomonosporaceae]|uniref:YegP family protein n=1 Tax=Thermomonosporaceae TaxID=2012 RepID=UPI00255B3BB8|nr:MULTISPECIES: YegP family protein [Thermomonosporaceae]MDL4774286.1 YegP family protein [Actinomadura xylanilytica]
MTGKFVIIKDKAGAFRFKLVAGNGETIAVSEGYGSKAGALHGVESVRTNAQAAKVEDRTQKV